MTDVLFWNGQKGATDIYRPPSHLMMRGGYSGGTLGLHNAALTGARVKTTEIKDMTDLIKTTDSKETHGVSASELNALLCFGKYKGQTVEQVMRNDAQYLLWAEEQGILSFSDDLQEGITECADIQHAEFLRDYCDNEQCLEF